MMVTITMQNMFLCSYHLMMKCWNARAELRPSFAEVASQLSTELGVMADYLDFSAPISTDQLDTEL